MSLTTKLIKAVFASASGDLTAANSPPAADNSKRLATTEWAAFGFAILKSANGYIKLPTWLGGLIIQWGVVNAVANTTTTAMYPIPFPTAAIFVTGNVGVPINAGPWAVGIAQFTAAACKIQNTDTLDHGCSFIAIGH